MNFGVSSSSKQTQAYDNNSVLEKGVVFLCELFQIDVPLKCRVR